MPEFKGTIIGVPEEIGRLEREVAALKLDNVTLRSELEDAAETLDTIIRANGKPHGLNLDVRLMGYRTALALVRPPPSDVHSGVPDHHECVHCYGRIKEGEGYVVGPGGKAHTDCDQAVPREARVSVPADCGGKRAQAIVDIASEAVLGMTDEEVRTEAARDGVDLEANAARFRALLGRPWPGSGNYVADRVEDPTRVIFANGRMVAVKDGHLVIGWDETRDSENARGGGLAPTFTAREGVTAAPGGIGDGYGIVRDENREFKE